VIRGGGCQRVRRLLRQQPLTQTLRTLLNLLVCHTFLTQFFLKLKDFRFNRMLAVVFEQLRVAHGLFLV
jgi:hypothetical protein